MRRHQLSAAAEIEKSQGVGDPSQLVGYRREICLLRSTLADVTVERHLDARQILLDTRRDHLQGIQIGTAENALGTLRSVLADEQIIESIGGANGCDARGRRGRASQIVKQILDQIGRRGAPQRRASVHGDVLQLLIQQPQKAAHRDTRFQSAFSQCLDDAGGNPPQTHTGRAAAQPFAARHNRLHERQAGFIHRALIPVQQSLLVIGAQAARDLAQLILVQIVGLFRTRNVDFQVRREKSIFREQGLAAHASQIVQQRHENRRCVLMTGAQVAQVLSELQNTAQQELAHFLVGIVDIGTLQQAAQALHFLQQQARAIVLEHFEHTVHAVQRVGAALHVVRRVGVFRESFQRRACLRQRLLDVTLHPLERGVIHA